MLKNTKELFLYLYVSMDINKYFLFYLGDFDLFIANRLQTYLKSYQKTSVCH